MFYPMFEQWQKDLLEGESKLWSHLHAMERGDEGGFCRALYGAMSKADNNNNSRRLYEAFPEMFSPNF